MDNTKLLLRYFINRIERTESLKQFLCCNGARSRNYKDMEGCPPKWHRRCTQEHQQSTVKTQEQRDQLDQQIDQIYSYITHIDNVN
jgi:hypothetical protein